MRKLKSLKGAKLLSRKEQQGIKGGDFFCNSVEHPCPPNYECIGDICIYTPPGWGDPEV